MVSAGMGAGHDTVAGELARRLRERGCHVARRDLLGLFPAGTGACLRGAYRLTIRRMPWAYGLVYTAFFRSRRSGRHPGIAPVSSLVEAELLRAVENERPDVIVSTFHLAAQVAGRLRSRGLLAVPSAVVVTDFAVHRQWAHPGNDLHLCVTEVAAVRAREQSGRRATASGPVVPPAFEPSRALRDSTGWAHLLARQAPGRPRVLVSLGAWATGSDPCRTASLLHEAGYLPVVLCGHDDRLRRRVARHSGNLALGWVHGLAGLMAAADALVDNAAGQTALQALSVGLPVVGYRPIPGHGVEGVAGMAAAGLSQYARSPGELLRALQAVTGDGPVREERVAAGRSIFRADAARLVAELADLPGPAPVVADG
ncbi:hypothetical protein N566_13640 [Streptomycetaceae bacterium MP113-05]|nr:hypothetical protein N566_13640 [Streptomycetaceae bacterium MP113-05]